MANNKYYVAVLGNKTPGEWYLVLREDLGPGVAPNKIKDMWLWITPRFLARWIAKMWLKSYLRQLRRDAILFRVDLGGPND